MLLAIATDAKQGGVIMKTEVVLYPEGIGLELFYEIGCVFCEIFKPGVAKRACHTFGYLSFHIDECCKVLSLVPMASAVAMTDLYPVIDADRKPFFSDCRRSLFKHGYPGLRHLHGNVSDVELLLIYAEHNVVKSVSRAMLGDAFYSFVLHTVGGKLNS